MKKSQLSIFVIIGLIIVIIIGTLFLLKAEKKDTVFDLESIKSGSANLNQDFLENYVEHCTEITTIEAEKRFGLNKASSAAPIAAYISAQLPVCLEEFEIFKKQGFDVEYDLPEVTVQITNNALIADVIFPITLTKDKLKLKFSDTSYTFPRTVTEEIDLGKTTIITSTDKSFVIEIEPGTKAYVGDTEVDEIGLKQLDKNFNGLSNNVVAGMLTFNAEPHGAQFSKPVKIIKYYEEKDVPVFINEKNLKIGYYHDKIGIWIGLPTEVYPELNKLVAYTNHFSPHAMVINCGGEDPLKQVVTPVILKQVCDNKNTKGCDGWNYDEDVEPYGELYKNKDDVTILGNDDVFGKHATPREEMYEIQYSTEDNNVLTKIIDSGDNNKLGQYDNRDVCPHNKICDLEDYEDMKQFQQILVCEDVEDLDNENKFLIFGVGENVPDDFVPNTDDCMGSSSGDNCKFSSDPEVILRNFKDLDNVVITKEFCNDECNGKCIEIGKIDGEEKAVCYADYVNYKYATTVKEGNNVEDNKFGLSGQMLYKIEFEKSGNACVASGGASETPTNNIENWDIWGSSRETSENSDAETTGERISQEVTIVRDTNFWGSSTEPIRLHIEPLCYKEDNCAIRNAYFVEQTEDDNPYAFFMLEVENSEENPDACIKGNAVITFDGIGYFGNADMLCNEDTEGQMDYVKGYCSFCVKKMCNQYDVDVCVDFPTEDSRYTIPKYVWEATTEDKQTKCLYLEGKCAPSAIGKIYPHPDKTQTTCIECNIGNNPYYGEATIMEDRCDCLTEQSPPSATDEGS